MNEIPLIFSLDPTLTDYERCYGSLTEEKKQQLPTRLELANQCRRLLYQAYVEESNGKSPWAISRARDFLFTMEYFATAMMTRILCGFAYSLQKPYTSQAGLNFTLQTTININAIIATL